MESGKESYKQIFKSTSIVGGAQILNIIIGVVKTKLIALLLGPGGVGITGIFQTICELVRNATGFGINFSGVKSVAENNTNPQKIARTILILRRWEFGTGLMGTLIIIILSGVFSKYSFGGSAYTASIALVSVTLLINAVSAGQLAILQGLRRIREMAKASFLGSVLGIILSVPLIWWLGSSGIVPSLILTALGSLAVSWFYARRIITEKVNISPVDTFKEGLGMAKLGFFIVVNGFIATTALYFIRALIRSNLGINYVGYFQAVWTISTLYINILLNAMLADYFPQLSTIKDDRVASNHLINQQLEMTILIGAPMLAVMITMASPIMTILYSSSFQSAIPVFKWQMMASYFTFLSWPLGVLYLSKDKGIYAIVSETIRQTIYILVIFIGWRYMGFNILGIGFFIANIGGLIFVLISVSKINAFKLTPVNLKYSFIFAAMLLFMLIVSFEIDNFYQYIINGIILMIMLAISLNKLNKLIDVGAWFNRKFMLSRNNNS